MRRLLVSLTLTLLAGPTIFAAPDPDPMSTGSVALAALSDDLPTSETAVWSIAGTVPPLHPDSSRPDAAARHFIRTCAGCHTIGQGVLTGPDLKPTAAWPEVDRISAIKRMEKQVGPLKPEEVTELAALLGDERARERIANAEKLEAQAVIAKMEKPSAEKGRKLYTGQLGLENGGSACIACHSTSKTGGNLALDLTHVYSKMGESALQSAIEQSSFKVMNAAYRDHKITKQEAMHLTAYFKEVDTDPPQVRASLFIPISGIGGTIILLGAMVLGNRKRNRTTRVGLRRH